ncbi:MAG: hypothetical protein IJO33_02240 [Bacilli bacterium]|nr:hypothetical protein [Bacilli bacterium]
MNKSKNILYLAIGLIILALLTTLFMDDGLSQKVVTVITTVTALVGAIALFIQFKRDKDINEAEFILSYGKYFHEVDGNDKVFAKLDNDMNSLTDEDHEGIVNCLVWCEGLSVLIQQGVMNLKIVDNLFSYQFFLIVNNKYVQEKELIPYAEYYKGIYALHKIWSDYKKATGQPIFNEEFSLEKANNYLEYVQKGDIFDQEHF